MDAKSSLATLCFTALASLFADSAAAAEGPYTALTGGANYPRDQRGTQFDDGPLMGVSIGYMFRQGFHPEIELAFRENETESGTEGSGDAAAFMVNHWIDLPLTARWHPYFGVGGGRANLERVDANGISTGEETTVWAYQGGAGIGYYFTPRVALSLGWRYFATEHPEFEDGTALARYRANAALAMLRIGFGRERVRLVKSEQPQPPAAEAAAFETVVLRAVNFQFDKAELTEPARQTLDQLAAHLAGHPEIRVTIEGHADAIGSNEYNVALSERRALAVVNYLAAKGIRRESFEIRSFGENKPITTNATLEGRAENRRAAFNVPEEPPRVRIEIEPPTEESVEAAKAGGDPGPRGPNEPAPPQQAPDSGARE